MIYTITRTSANVPSERNRLIATWVATGLQSQPLICVWTCAGIQTGASARLPAPSPDAHAAPDAPVELRRCA